MNVLAGNEKLLQQRDFNLTDRDFKTIRKIVAERTGIMLSDAKRQMVYSRLSRRLRAIGMTEFKDYCDLINSGDEHEIAEFTNAITTNLTAFFREPHHFQFLEKKLIPHLLQTKQERKLRIWSAGCSSGEEPYSLAMILHESFPAEWDVKILATDLDSNMVNKGSQGIYTSERVEGLSKERLKRWVQKGKGENFDMVRMHRDLRDMITFKQLNLMHEWPMRGPFDFIFCRNVVIYFNKETQRLLFHRFAEMLENESHIFIGHSESLYKVSDQFKSLGQTIYQKTA